MTSKTCHECFDTTTETHKLVDCLFEPNKKFTGNACGYNAEYKKLIKRRIDYLLMRLNIGYKIKNAKFSGKAKIFVAKEKMEKKDTNALKKELVGYGIIPVRIREKKVVDILTDECTWYSNFIINGIEETSLGTIIGYYCPACQTASSVHDAANLFVKDYQTELLNCNTCNSYDVKPLWWADIVTDEEKKEWAESGISPMGY